MVETQSNERPRVLQNAFSVSQYHYTGFFSTYFTITGIKNSLKYCQLYRGVIISRFHYTSGLTGCQELFNTHKPF